MTKYVNNNGVSEMWLNIKNWVTSQLLGYSQTGHTHTKSQITDLDLSNYVDKTSNQTIPGNKTFTGFIDINSYRLRIKHNSQEIGITPSSNQWNGIVFADKNNLSTFTIEQAFLKNGNTMVHFSMTPNIANGSLLRIFDSTYNPSTAEIVTKSRTLIPDANNSRNLGSSSNVWQNVYANNYYLGNTAFGNIVTHNASEFAQVGHTHSASEITDLQERWDYDSNSNAILVRGGSDVWTYDQQNDSVIVS